MLRADNEELIETTYVCEKDGRIAGSCVLEIYSPKIAEMRLLTGQPVRTHQCSGVVAPKLAIEQSKHPLAHLHRLRVCPFTAEGLCKKLLSVKSLGAELRQLLRPAPHLTGEGRTYGACVSPPARLAGAPSLSASVPLLRKSFLD